jgi:hypothetical protein
MTAVNYFWDESTMLEVAGSPTILAVGDSWFWYPFPGGSLVNQLGRIVASRRHVIFATGMNGAEAYDYVDGKYARMVREALRLYGQGLSAVFISGGGNDFAGFNDLRPLLKQNCSRERNARDCFAEGDPGLQGFLDGVDQSYRKLIGSIYTHTGPDCVVVMHTYDISVPSGKGAFGAGGWLLPALDDAKVPRELHEDCIAFLLNAFAHVLSNICENDRNHLALVDSRGILSPDEWANELHPTPAGFARIANEGWKPVLQDLGLAD